MTVTTRPASIRISTADIGRLVHFYKMVAGVQAPSCGGRHSPWPSAVPRPLHCSAVTLHRPRPTRSVIVEFQVENVDVDHDHDRIRAADPAVVVAQLPTTMPWGNRSLLLRAPDGTSSTCSPHRSPAATCPSPIDRGVPPE